MRDWIHVEDHCAGILLALEKGKSGESYCFGGNAERTNLAVVEALCDLVDRFVPDARIGPRRHLGQVGDTQYLTLLPQFMQETANNFGHQEPGTNQQIKDNFRYTSGARNTHAPEFTSSTPLSVTTGENGATALRIAQAKDDQMVHHYAVEVTDTATGAKVVSSKVLSDFYFMPRPNSLDIPIPDAAAGTAYEARVEAVDAYGNRSPVTTLAFTR